MTTVLKLTSTVLPKNKHLQSWTKYLEISKEIKQNWAGQGNFETCFL